MPARTKLLIPCSIEHYWAAVRIISFNPLILWDIDNFFWIHYWVNWNSGRLSNLTSHTSSEWEDWHSKLGCLTSNLFYFPLKSSNKLTFVETRERNFLYFSVPKFLPNVLIFELLNGKRYWDNIFSIFPCKEGI